MPNESQPKKQTSFVLYNELSAPYPFLALSYSVALDSVFNPPDYGGGDRTKEDRERHKDRIRDQIKPQLPSIIGGNPIFGDKGKIKVPVQGGYEPRFRYGRDKKGGGGGGGQNPSADPGDLIYVEISLEELIQMLFEEMELPDMLKKQMATTKVLAHKYRGTQPNGPKPRLKKADTARARVRRAVAMRNARPEDFEDGEEESEKSKKAKNNIPSPKKVPFNKKDRRYHRVEETFDDDSKCVVFFKLDRSGSMGGDPLMIAKAYFLLNLLFLRTKYRDVKVVMIAHDAQAYRIQDERKFYEIEVDGGTMFGPAYEMIYKIRQSEFPVSEWNAYMFDATDGYMFDGQGEVQRWFIKLLKEAQFNYLGYLEIGTPWGGRWASGGQAINSLPAEIKTHVGLARANSIKDVPEAFKEILTKDKKKGA